MARLTAVLSLALSLYWGVLGCHMGAATRHLCVGALLAVVSFAVALGVHRASFLSIAQQPIDPDSLSLDVSADCRMSPYTARSFHGAPQGKVIDVECRVVS